MRSSTMISTITENARNYEVALRRAEQALADANESDLSLQRDLSDALRRFAGVQLDEGAFKSSTELQAILSVRHAEEKNLRAQLATEEASIAEALDHIQVARGGIDSATEAVREALSEKTEYVEAFSRYQVAGSSLASARPAYEEIARECEEKLPAFEQDRLYVYLRGIGFGTDQYRRGNLRRTIDRWVAGLCNYMENRASETALLAMREVNAASFARLERQLEEAQAFTQSLINAALEQAGVSKMEAQLAEAEADLKVKKSRASQLQDSLLEFSRKADRHYQDAMDKLSATLGDCAVADLHRMANITSDESDNDAASDIEKIQARLTQLKGSIPRLRAEADEARSSYDRAKRLERELRDSRYSSSTYQYRGGLDLQDLLTGYMAGALSQRDVVSEVEDYRELVYTPAPRQSGGGGMSGGSPGSVFGGFSSSGSDGGGGFSTSDSL